MEVTVDLVVLSVGMEPSEGTRKVAQILGIKQNKYGYIEAGGMTGVDPVATSRPGIFVAGAAAGPADLDDTFSMAGLAVGSAISSSRSPGRTTRNSRPLWKKGCSRLPPRTWSQLRMT